MYDEIVLPVIKKGQVSEKYATPTVGLSAKQTQFCTSIFHPRADGSFPLSFLSILVTGRTLLWLSLNSLPRQKM